MPSRGNGSRVREGWMSVSRWQLWRREEHYGEEAERGRGFEEARKTLGWPKGLQQCDPLLHSKRPSNFSVASERNRRVSAVGCCLTSSL